MQMDPVPGSLQWTKGIADRLKVSGQQRKPDDFPKQKMYLCLSGNSRSKDQLLKSQFPSHLPDSEAAWTPKWLE